MPKNKNYGYAISLELRMLVLKRANNFCEYCRINQEFCEYPFHLDHIISLKHGGTSTEGNLALSCPDCNFHKGTNLGTFLAPPERDFTLLFHPRLDNWSEHFEEIDGFIKPLTLVGEATVQILMFNTTERIILRREIANF